MLYVRALLVLVWCDIEVMRLRWRLFLPILGLFLFGVESYWSFRLNRELGSTPRKYYYWSSIRLDSDPLRTTYSKSCKPENEACDWKPTWVWIDSGYVAKAVMSLCLPAFALGAVAVIGLGHLGISEVQSFLALMPVLVFAWLYLVGWLLDSWRRKRLLAAAKSS